MTKKQTYCFIAFIIGALFPTTQAQTLLHIQNGCHFNGDETPKTLYGYDPRSRMSAAMILAFELFETIKLAPFYPFDITAKRSNFFGESGVLLRGQNAF